jgi:uncharacterized protein YwbE
MSDEIDDLIDELQVIDADIKREAVNQVGLFIRAARLRVDAMRARARSSAELESRRAGLAVAIRNKKDAKGGKLTEGALKEKLETHSVVKMLREKSDRTYEVEELTKLILEVCRQRRDSIRIIAEMQSLEGSREGAEVERLEQRRRLSNKARVVQSHRRGL